jgi:hypothetical protein
MRHVFHIEGYFYCIAFEAIMHISDAVFEGLVLDFNHKGFLDLAPVLNLIQDPI